MPTVDWDRTARDVLTLEWIDGTPLNDRAALEARGLDLPALGRNVIQSFLRHALRDGFFHADMHPGNLFVDAGGRLVAVDFGIMGRLGPKERRFLAEILYGFITRDYQRTAQVHFDAGYVPRHHSVEDFAQAIRAIGEPIHNRTAEDISTDELLRRGGGDREDGAELGDAELRDERAAGSGDGFLVLTAGDGERGSSVDGLGWVEVGPAGGDLEELGGCLVLSGLAITSQREQVGGGEGVCLTCLRCLLQ